MKAVECSWSTVVFQLLSAAVIIPMQTWAYKILVIPLPGKSHIFQLAAVSESLVDRGHQVIFFVGENNPLNLPELRNRSEFRVVRYRDTANGAHASYNYDAMEENFTKSALESSEDVYQMLSTVWKISREWCRQLTTDNDDVMQELEREQIDMAVVDGYFFTRCYYLVPHRLQIPWVTFAVGVDPLLIRVPWLPSFVPFQIFSYSDRMSFTERFTNTMFSIFCSFTLPMTFPDPKPEVMEKFYRYGYFSSIDELMSKSALWLLALDAVTDYPRPMMPNMINVAGLTVKRSSGELPPIIKNFIDGAEKGIILMTFGSLASSIPARMVEKFSSAFRRLDGYRVIWRLNNKDDVELPDNVMISQWLPQNDILAHPFVKLFITHCGNSGQYEAMYHAVPMIGFPFLGDQMYNAKRIDHRGYGLTMDLHDFTADQLLDNIYKILGDKLYKERVAKASEIFRSQPQSPVERATFWIEHVCRFGGDHLRSAGNDLPLYSYLMLDILAFMLVILHILAYLLYRLFKLIANKCCGRATPSNASKKND